MADRDFLSLRGDKLSYLVEHLYLLKSWAHIGFEWIETTVVRCQGRWAYFE